MCHVILYMMDHEHGSVEINTVRIVVVIKVECVYIYIGMSYSPPIDTHLFTTISVGFTFLSFRVCYTYKSIKFIG